MPSGNESSLLSSRVDEEIDIPCFRRHRLWLRIVKILRRPPAAQGFV